MVGDIILHKLKDKLEDCYSGCKFMIRESKDEIEILYSDIKYFNDNKFLEDVIDICSEFMSEDDLWNLVITFDVLKEIDF